MASSNVIQQFLARYNRQLGFVALVSIAIIVLWKHGDNIQNYNQLLANSISYPDNQKDSPTKHVSTLCNCGKVIAMPDESNLPDPNAFQWCSPESSVRGTHQKVITYTLYGNVQDSAISKRYFSLLKNISLTTEKYYPGWIVRIYHNIRDRDGPEKEAHSQLCDIYCRFSHVDLCSFPLLVERIGSSTIPIDPAHLTGLNPRMFRYLVMLDPNTDIFISRDIDSIIWRREVDAVEEWLRSNYTFHVMRDHNNHGVVALAGNLTSNFYG